MTQGHDVIVVGAGNAAFSSALAAQDEGARVLVLERAPREERGGNTAFTAGSFRTVYEGTDDVLRIVGDLSEEEVGGTDFGAYTRKEFFDDIARVTHFRADPDLAEMLVDGSLDTVLWLRSKGIRFVPKFGRQAYKVDGKFRFWGGSTVQVSGGGIGLVDSLARAYERSGGSIEYETRAVRLVTDERGVSGVIATRAGREEEFRAPSVIIASGGFQSNVEWRARYLGPDWDLAKVRGTRYDTGDGIRMALDIGAAPTGHWSGCHSVGWDLNAPPYGDIRVGDGFNKHSYQFGIMVNADGERFLDEGADFRNYTYAKYGRIILQQPGQFAWQIFDSKVADLLVHDFYRIPQVTRVAADSIEGLADKLAEEGIDRTRLLRTIAQYNNAVDDSRPFDPTRKDSRGTPGLGQPKSNWANRIDAGPYEAYGVTCGVTFTFGGLGIDQDAAVRDVDGKAIPGLFAAGEVVGGLFYHNYPGSTGLTWGAVTGRAAGAAAARRARPT